MKKYWEMWLVTITNWIWEATKKEGLILLPLFATGLHKSRLWEHKIHKTKTMSRPAIDHLTYQLNRSEIFLPPQVLLVAGAHGSQAIVWVHDNMDNTVKQGMECPQTTWKTGSASGPPPQKSRKFIIECISCKFTIKNKKTKKTRKSYLLQTELQTTRWKAWLSDGRHEEMSPGYSSSSVQRRSVWGHKHPLSQKTVRHW